MPEGVPFWFKDMLCVKFQVMLTVHSGKRNFISLGTGYTGFIEPEGLDTVTYAKDVEVSFTK